MNLYSFTEGPLLWIVFLTFIIGILTRCGLLFYVTVRRGKSNKLLTWKYIPVTFWRLLLHFCNGLAKKPIYAALVTGYFLRHENLGSIDFLGNHPYILNVVSGKAMLIMAVFLFCSSRLIKESGIPSIPIPRLEKIKQMITHDHILLCPRCKKASYAESVLLLRPPKEGHLCIGGHH